jgi:hypothetical protein
MTRFTSLIAYLVVVVCVGVIASRIAALTTTRAAAQPVAQWQSGQCYRVFPHNRDQFYVFKVIERAEGTWVRVEVDPRNPVVPGARPALPLWLNTDALFAAQEWPCSR